MSKQREEFEAWCVAGWCWTGTFEDRMRIADLGAKQEVEMAWKVWQASRAAALEEMNGKKYGPYDVAFMGAGVWAGIPDELPPELVGKKVWVSPAGHNQGKKLQPNGSMIKRQQ